MQIAANLFDEAGVMSRERIPSWANDLLHSLRLVDGSSGIVSTAEESPRAESSGRPPALWTYPKGPQYIHTSRNIVLR